MEILLKNIFFY